MVADRPDLAAMLAPLVRALIAIEQPILDTNDLTIWGYTVLLRLDDSPTRTQAALAQSIGADKTRIIRVLDDLTERGYILRKPDPSDRRAHLISLTPAGREVRDRAQVEIQRREEVVLAALPAGERRSFLRALQQLSRSVEADGPSGRE
ncbi:MarR family winged helix-turn-helix transcriptional regulator [Antrihabitans spumae]|uniref:MarR family winged helix-turn-helix transcriptional regulator n=1 Tax=Antrihabitans spumae TaxID=3373370 RepID=A0ABW7KT72_9NOCA